ncbi:MAG: GNAT family N-acetyltransferase [Arenimonas sp.]
MTNRLLLRELEAGDVDTLVGYYKEPQSQAGILSRQRDPVHNTRVMKACADYNGRRKWFDRELHPFAACLRDGGEVIGYASLGYVGEGRMVFGWHFGVAYAGRGYATEVGAELLRFAFVQLQAGSVYADCNATNPAAIAIFRKLGMRPTANGAIRSWLRGLKYGELRPILRHLLDRADFSGSRVPPVPVGDTSRLSGEPSCG